MDKIERKVNDKIRENIKVRFEELDAEDAFKTGAKALFDEKYGDIVRVVSMESFSSEFCGGTHTDRTGNIGLFKMLSQSSIAAGVRRIEAVTGSAAVMLTQAEGKIIQDTAGLLRERPESLTERVEKLLSDHKSLEKELDRLKGKIASKSADEAEDEYKTVKNVKILSKKVPIDNPGALRDLADKFKDRIKSGIVVLGAVAEEKALLIVIVTKDLIKDFHAGKIVKELAKEVGGSGGGRPDMAQAGGTKPENMEKALNKIFQIIEG
jgi:alanyl-tRNA synthetase